MTEIFERLADPLPRTIAGFLLAGAIALLARRLQALTTDGAVTATLLGGGIVAIAGWWVGATLVLYFATSSTLSIFAARRRDDDAQARGKQRDTVQVLANGGIAGLCALGALIPGYQDASRVAAEAAIAAATADTWATEIGRFSPVPPRLITTGRQVASGISGAVSALGTTGAICSAVLIGGFAAIGLNPGLSPLALTVTIATAGVAGALADSVLGATIQEQRWCPECHMATEQNPHRCGIPTTHRRGWSWLNNDAVNAISICIAPIFAILVMTIANSFG